VSVTKDNIMAGPTCYDEQDFLRVCVHESCNKIDSVTICPRNPAEHGMQEIVETGDYIGFAGGRCWYATLACGCVDADESRDVAAAR
jgi:hypothetical protein